MAQNELNDNDKQRIYEAYDKWDESTYYLRYTKQGAFFEGAEYEHKYQRERQANGLKSIENPGHHIKVLKEQIQRMEKEYKELEAERSELKELLWICQDFLPQGVGDESDYYDRIRARIKNSLKTK